VVVVYPHPVSLSTQKVTAEKLVPCDEWLIKKKTESVNPEQMIWESTPEVILQYSVHQWIEYRLLELFTLSRLSEMAARVMHLEGSYQELVRQGKKIKLQYFRARHEVIDRSMREVFSSQLLMGRKKLEELAKLGLA
jgi:F0F1-type ATP synthase gamma subunit